MKKYELRDNFKLLIKYTLRFGLKLFWVFPIRKDTVFFMANMGKACLCSPKYLYKSMVADEHFRNFSYVWCVKNAGAINKTDFDINTKVIDKNNMWSFFFHLLTSEYVVYNCGGFSYAPIRKKQMLIETWHGGGAFKKVGLAIDGKSESSKKGITLAMKDVKLFLSSCELSTKEFVRKSMCYEGEVLNCGLPRNDLLFKRDPKDIEKIRKKLLIGENEKIILYAPTFKGDESNAEIFTKGVELIDPARIKKAFSKKYGGEWKFFTRGHQYTKQIELVGADGDWSDYPDMQELLLICDVLVTDYSSSMWDFAIMRRPCYLFVPDLKKYESEERGFMVPFDTWPGIKAISNADFENQIETFSTEEYGDRIDQYFDMCGCYEHGNACDQVKDRMLMWRK